MKLFPAGYRFPGFALAILVITLAVFILLFLLVRERKETVLRQQGFRILSGLEASMKEKDETIGRVVDNLEPSFRQYERTLMVKQPGFQNSRLLPINPARIKPASLPDSSRQKFIQIKDKQIANPELSEKLTLALSANRVPADSILFPSHKDSIFSCTMGMLDFMSPLLRKDFFSGFIFIDDGQVAFSSLPVDIAPAAISGNRSQKFFGLNFQVLAENKVTDTSRSSGLALRSGTITGISISGRDYLLFSLPVKFHGKKNCIIGGFVEKKLFTGWKRNLTASWFMFFSIILLLLIFSYPVIRVFASGPRGRITQAGIITTGIAVVSGTFVLVMMFSCLKISYNAAQNNKRELRLLNDSIRHSFVQETEAALNELKRYDSVRYGKIIARVNVTNKPAVPEQVVFTSVLDDTSHSGYNNPAYKFFKSVFWADDAGNQVMLCTPYRNATLTNVAYRGYFRHPEKYCKIIGADSVWYGMEPLYSNSSGSWLIAVSTLSKEHLFPISVAPAAPPPKAKVAAITSPFVSLRDPVLPSGFEFCLAGGNGKVWYHSSEVLDLSSDILEECNGNEALASALKSGRSAFFSGVFLHRDCRMFVSPVEGTDLFLVTVIDPRKEKAASTSAILWAAGIFIIVLMLVLLSCAAAGMFMKKSCGHPRKGFFLSCVIPDKRKYKRYGSILILNLVVAAILFLVSFICGKFQVHRVNFSAICSFIIIIQGILIYILVNLPGKEGKTISLKAERIFRQFVFCIITWLFSLAVVFPVILTSWNVQGEVCRNCISRQAQAALGLNARSEKIHLFYRENIPSVNGYEISLERNKAGLYFESAGDMKLVDGPTAIFDSAYRAMQMHAAEKGENCTSSCSFAKFGNDLVAAFPVGDSLQVLRFARTGYLYPEGKTISNAFIKSRTDRIENHQGLFFSGFASLVFWIGLALILYLIYCMLRGITKEYFGTMLLQLKADSFGEILSAPRNDQNLVLVSAYNPAAEEIPGWIVLDLADPNLRIPKYGSGIILTNAGENISSLKLLKRRLRSFERVMLLKPCALIFRVTPEILISRLASALAVPGKEDKLASLLDRLVRLLSGLPLLTVVPGMVAKDYGEACPCMRRILDAERRFNPGTDAIIPTLKLHFPECWDSQANDGRERDRCMDCRCRKHEIIRDVLQLSYSWHGHAWNALSDPEKIILLDLAGDGHVGTNDEPALLLLVRKGILETADDLQFISPSFRQYLLECGTNSDLEQRRNDRSQTGLWEIVRIPVVMAAAAILVFLVISKQAVLSDLNSILVSVAAISGVFLKLAGLFPPAK